MRSGPREDEPVTIAVQSETGKRIQGQFSPSESLYNVISATIGVPDTKKNQEVVCIYMRKEVIGEDALQATSLKSLGLVSGSAMLRVIVRDGEAMKTQAHVEHLKLKKPAAETSKTAEVVSDVKQNVSKFGKSLKKMVSGVFESVSQAAPNAESGSKEPEKKAPTFTGTTQRLGSLPKASEVNETVRTVTRAVPQPAESEGIHWLGERDALVFRLEDMSRMRSSDTSDDPSDDFFEHTQDDMLLIYNDLKQKIREMDDRPLETEALREKKVMSTKYTKTVLRICFPADGLVIQATFSPTDTIETVQKFVRKYLNDASTDFYLYTTPPKQVLVPQDVLIKKHLVPAAMIQFGHSDPSLPSLKPELLSQITSFHAIASATSEMRREISHRVQSSAQVAPNDVPEHRHESIPEPMTSTKLTPRATQDQKVPKWFKKQ